MDDLNALVQEAIAAVKAGRKQEGRDKLLAVIERDDRHEQAWLGLSALVETMEERLICLENVLAINPNNERAKNALAKLGGQPPAPPAPPVQPPTPAPRTAPPVEEPYDPFSNTAFEPFDPYQASPSSPSLGDVSFGDLGTSGSAAEVEDDVPDWYRSVPSQAGGQDTDHASDEQYDQWVERLNLNPGADSSPGGTFSDGPFGGDSPFESTPAPWDDPSLDADFSPSDAPWSAASGPFDDLGESEAFGGPGSSSPFDRQPAPQPVSSSPSGGAFTFDSAPGDEANDDEPFSFDFDDDPVPAASSSPASWLTQASAPVPSAPVAGANLAAASAAAVTPSAVPATGASSANMQAYFLQIPADIEAVPPHGISRQRVMLVLGIFMLLVLNAASIGLLVTSL